MKHFKHKHFSNLVSDCVKMLHYTQLSQHKDNMYAQVVTATIPSLIEAEHMVVDLSTLPDADEVITELHMPHDVLLIGFEREDSAEDIIQTTLQKQIARTLDAVLVLTPDLPEDDLEIEDTAHANLVLLPFFQNVDKAKPLTWTLTGLVINIYSDSKGIKYSYTLTDDSPFKFSDSSMTEAIVSTLISALADLHSLLACSNIETELVEPSGLAKMQAKKKKLPLKSFTQVKLPQPIKPKQQSQGGTHASPRFHRRRGHYRTYHRGERYENKIWIAPMAVGDPQGPKITHDYIVRKK